MKCLLIALFLCTAGAVLAPLYEVDKEDAILDHFIVVFEQDNDVQECIDTVINHPVFIAMGGEVILSYSHVIGGFAGVLPPGLVDVVRSFPFVKYVQADQATRADAVASWGLDRIDSRNLTEDSNFTPRNNGTGVNVYIIDSGINPTHVDFSGRASTNDTIDFCKAPNSGIDCYGHGTHCAGVAGGDTYGVAKNVSIFAVRVLNCNGIGIASRTIKAIDWVAANHTKPAVASISFGSGIHQATDDAVAGMYNAGVTVVCSAGNGQEDANNRSPARQPLAITVGALSKANTRAYFSNYGDLVDLFAPGMGIQSDWWDSDTATRGKSGTSMAAPHVAGAAAIVLSEDPSLDPADVTQRLIEDSTKDEIVEDPLAANRVVYVGALD